MSRGHGCRVVGGACQQAWVCGPNFLGLALEGRISWDGALEGWEAVDAAKAHTEAGPPIGVAGRGAGR
jgi:hypothetical protein